MGNGPWLREKKVAILLNKILPHLLLSLQFHIFPPVCMKLLEALFPSESIPFLRCLIILLYFCLPFGLLTLPFWLSLANHVAEEGLSDAPAHMKPPYITSNLPVVLCTFTMRLDFTIHICGYSTWGLDHNCTLKLHTGRTFLDLTQAIRCLLWTSVSPSTLSMASFFIIYFSNQCSAVMMVLLPYVFNEPTKSISLKYIR